jgi:hypothetical protein
MPTPNWGPQSGLPMDDATFDAYVAANPPGTKGSDGIYRNTLAGQDTNAAALAIAPLLNQSRVTNWSQQAINGPQTFQSEYQTANQDQARLQQERVLQDLQRQASGDPNSLAQQQLQQGYGAAQAQQSSLGSTMRGQSAGAAMRGIQAGQQGIQRGFAGDQQMLQAQEQQAAQAMIAQLLAQQQGQDINQAQGVANASLGASGLNDAMKQFYMSTGVAGDTSALQTINDFNRARYGFDLEAQRAQDDIQRRAIESATTGGFTALSAFGGGGSKPPKSSQQNIDEAFNG